MAQGAGKPLRDSLVSQAAVLSEFVAGRIESTLARAGLTFGAFELLSAVRGAPSATQVELAAKLGITPSSFCEAARAAAKKGLVEQEAPISDRRTKRLVLTRKGAKALEEALRAMEYLEGVAVEGIVPSKLAVATEVLELACRNLSRGGT